MHKKGQALGLLVFLIIAIFMFVFGAIILSNIGNNTIDDNSSISNKTYIPYSNESYAMGENMPASTKEEIDQQIKDNTVQIISG